MKKINNYILEKLHLDKDLKIDKSKYCDIYNVDEGDKVLVICSSKKSTNTYKYIKLFAAEIDEISNDKITVKSLKTGRVVSELKYDFEDHTKSSPHIPGTFAFFKTVKSWSALMKLDKAEKIFTKIKNNDLFILNQFRFDSGDINKKDAVKELEKYLEI